MVDIHSHILAGIDDGSKDIEMAIILGEPSINTFGNLTLKILPLFNILSTDILPLWTTTIDITIFSPIQLNILRVREVLK